MTDKTITYICDLIKTINKKGYPVIFIVTGNNSSGKTTVTRLLLQRLPFYQTINLGLVSKIIRFFRKDLHVNELENFESKEANHLFEQIIDFIIDHYFDKGVNIILEGVQINTEKLLPNNRLIGGIILRVDDFNRITRNKTSLTHKIRSKTPNLIENITYIPNRKFEIVDNNGLIDDTYSCVLRTITTQLEEYLSYIK